MNGISLKFMKREKPSAGPAAAFGNGTLFIDCRGCAEPSSLGNAGCVKCVSRKISDVGTPSRLVMRKDNDTEYSESVISVMSGIAEIGSLMDAASSERMRSGCRGCGASLPENAKNIWNSFPEPGFDVIRTEAERSVGKGEGCEECVQRTLGFIDRTEAAFAGLRKKAAKAAFRLTEV